jgi:membrane-associated phospholipid phosphatase
VRVARIPVLVTALALLLAVGIFAAATVAVVSWNDADELDVRLVTWTHDAAPAALVDVMRVLTYLGSVVVLGPVALIAGILLARRGYWRSATFVFSAFLAGQLVSQGLKSAVERQRPQLDEPYVLLSTYAFPSGHAFGAATTWGALALVAWSLTSSRRRRALAVTAAALAVAVVAASRVILGAHYALDVLAGVSGGAAVLAALVLALGRVRLRRQEQPQRTGLDRELERRLEQNGLAVDRGAGDRRP